MLMNTYNRFPVTFVRGEGVRLYDDKGDSYLDFASGIGVNSVGHAHPKWLDAVTKQASQLAHVSNLFHTLPGAGLAKKLTDITGLENVFFANSGAEANEGMIKMARKYSKDKYGPGRHTILTLKQSFHGRTISTLAATGQEVFHKNFDPFTPGFCHITANDIGEMEKHDGICAVILEVIQGEGGVIPLTGDYISKVASLCEQRDWLLMIDEIQTGVGRTGSWFAYMDYGVLPDAVSFAKGIAGGLPLGGFMAGKKCAGTLGQGDHATTFGANPVVCAAGLAVLEIIGEALPGIKEKGKKIISALNGINGLSNPRGAGLMIGADIDAGKHESARALAEKLLASKLVCLTAGGESLRLMPPLVISDKEIQEGIDVIRGVCF